MISVGNLKPVSVSEIQLFKVDTSYRCFAFISDFGNLKHVSVSEIQTPKLSFVRFYI